MYQAYGLIRPNSDFTFPVLLERLKVKLPHLNLQNEGDQIVLSSEDWEIHLSLNSDPSVLTESQEIAEKIAGIEDGSDIASCNRRIEIASDSDDPVMGHFNDYLIVVEVVQSFRGVIGIEPSEPSLL